MTESPNFKEIFPVEGVDQWLGNDFAWTSYSFNFRDELAIKPYIDLNHLLSMASLRRFHNSLEQPFDKQMLNELRDSVTLFSTTGKTTAQHLPLVRQHLRNDDWEYVIGSQRYPTSAITPALHSSASFMTDNKKALPISDFQNALVTTRILKENKEITVDRKSRGRAVKSNVKFLTRDSTPVFTHTFDKCSHDTPWSVTLLKDNNSENHWLEFVVRTSEQFGSRRQHATPYIVCLNASPDLIEAFTSQFAQAITSLKRPKDSHALLYFLTSVIYFQSDPDYPYLTPDVKPGDISEELPRDLHGMALQVNDIAKAPSIFNQSLEEADGLKVVEKLYNLGTVQDDKKHKSLDKTIEELKAAFGPEYEALSSKIHNKLAEVATGVKIKVSEQVQWRSGRSEAFNLAMETVLSDAFKIIGKVFKLDISSPESADREKLRALMDTDNVLDSHRSVFNIPNVKIENVTRYVQEALITNVLKSLMNQTISEMQKGSALKKMATNNSLRRSFIKKAKKLIHEVEQGWNLREIESVFCQRLSYSDKTIEALFDQRLRAARRS